MWSILYKPLYDRILRVWSHQKVATNVDHLGKHLGVLPTYDSVL